MSDFKTIARILGAIRSCEGRPFDVAAVSPEALGVSEEQRDMLACKLQRAGKVGGLMTTEDIDGAPLRVLWAQSEPEVTLDGGVHGHLRAAKERRARGRWRVGVGGGLRHGRHALFDAVAQPKPRHGSGPRHHGGGLSLAA